MANPTNPSHAFSSPSDPWLPPLILCSSIINGTTRHQGEQHQENVTRRAAQSSPGKTGSWGRKMSSGVLQTVSWKCRQLLSCAWFDLATSAPSNLTNLPPLIWHFCPHSRAFLQSGLWAMGCGRANIWGWFQQWRRWPGHQCLCRQKCSKWRHQSPLWGVLATVCLVGSATFQNVCSDSAPDTSNIKRQKLKLNLGLLKISTKYIKDLIVNSRIVQCTIETCVILAL